MIARYAAALLPLAILVLGVLDAAERIGANLLGWQTVVQIVILLATTGAAYWLPLVPGRWVGALKTGAAVVGAIASALVATIPTGEFTSATLILFLTAAIKAVATEIGVQIRTDDETAGSAATIGTISISAPSVGGAEAEQSGTVPDEPRHLAGS